MCHRSTAIANQAEKRQRGFDKSVDEWRRKLADVQAELERSLADGRSSNSDSFRMRAQLDETHESIEALRRENKNLSGTYHAVARTSTGASRRCAERTRTSRVRTTPWRVRVRK